MMLINFEDLLIVDNFDIDVFPNKLIEQRYKIFSSILEAHRVNLLPDGGVCFTFKSKDSIIYFEIYNNDEMGYIITNPINHEIIANEDINNFNDLTNILK